MTKKLYKSSTDKALCGVCGGLGEYFEIDSLIVRLIFVAFSLAYGSGLLIYIIMALIIPKKPANVQAEYTANPSSNTTYQDAEFSESNEGATQGYTASYSYTSTDSNAEEVHTYNIPKVEVNTEEKEAGKTTQTPEKRNKNVFGVLLIVLGGIIILKEIFPVIKGSLLFAIVAILFGLYIIFRKDK